MRSTAPTRWWRQAALLAGTVMVVTACGGTTTTGAPSAAPVTPAPAVSGAPSADTGYSGPPVTIEYAIWGDPAEINSQKAVVAGFTAANPSITVDVTVADWDAYWDKLQTGLAGGAAPDVFAMDGPLGPDYQTRDVLLDLTPYIEAEGYDLGQLDDNAVKDFTTKDGVVFGLPRDLNVIALFYNKDMFDAAGIAYPDDTWTWDKLVEVGKQLTKDNDGDGTIDQWGVYTETTDMENAWSSFVWQAGGDILTEDGTKSALDRPESAAGIQFLQDLIWKEKVIPDPAIFAETGDAFEQKVAAMEINGSWLVPTHEAAGIKLGIAPLPAGPAGKATSVNPTGAVVYAKTDARRPPGCSPSTSPAPRPRRRSWPSRPGAGEQADPRHQLPGVLRRRAGVRGLARVRPPRRLRGLQRVHHDPPDGARRERVQRTQQDGADAIASVNEELNGIPQAASNPAGADIDRAGRPAMSLLRVVIVSVRAGSACGSRGTAAVLRHAAVPQR
jgi:multiple sugar transport system substrate-binding protein